MEPFVTLFNRLVEHPDRCCNPSGSAVPQCFGCHLLRLDGELSCLYGVYWGLRAGILKEEDASEAKRRLLRYDRVDHRGLYLERGCRQQPVGVEIKMGTIYDPPIIGISHYVVQGDIHSVVSSGEGMNWRAVASAEADIVYEHREARNHPRSGYQALDLAVGNYVGSDGGKKRIDARVCRYNGCGWIEYRDRPGKILRFPLRSVLHGDASRSFVNALYLDATCRSYGDDETHVMNSSDNVSRQLAYVIKRAETARDRFETSAMFTVALPVQHSLGVDKSNEALVRICLKNLEKDARESKRQRGENVSASSAAQI